jgi:hypothetical protein
MQGQGRGRFHPVQLDWSQLGSNVHHRIRVSSRHLDTTVKIDDEKKRLV